MSETVLVTGGSGFIASWCIIELLQQGYAVRTTVRSEAKASSLRESLRPFVTASAQLSFFNADLTNDFSWDAAVRGCDYVLHVASPIGAGRRITDPNELIVPARDGALRVLRASCNAGIRRVVMTSSVAAAGSQRVDGNASHDETQWTDLRAPKLNAYRQSKTIAERAAWDFMRSQERATSLVTILPSVVLGPVLSMESLGSVQLVSRLLDGSTPGCPRLGFCIVDVRDVARAHLLAMTSNVAAGERFIVAGEFMWMKEIALLLREHLAARGKEIPTRELPDFLVHIAAFFNPPLREITPNLGHKHVYSAAKAQRLLGWSPRSSVSTVVECAESLLARTQ